MSRTYLAFLLVLVPVKANAAEFAFTAGWHSPLPKPLITAPLALPADESLSVKGETLVNSSGEEIRLWGAVLRITRRLLEAPERDKRLLILNMRKLGFNQVRFIGIDFPDPGIYDDWVRDHVFPEKKMRSFCDLVEAARAQGMYYSIDINHISSKYKFDTGPNAHTDPNKRGKVIQFYDDAAVSETRAWYQAFLNHKSPACKFKFRDDPRFFYLNIVNEDSVFSGYFSDFKHLTADNLSRLSESFREFIIKKHGTIELGLQDLNLPAVVDGQARDGKLPLCPHTSPLGDLGSWCADTVEFLATVEKQYFLALRETIKDSGYQGMVTTTNNWYGYHNFAINSSLGDATNTHIYFDPRRTITRFGKHLTAVRNFSFIDNPYQYRGWETNQVLRLFATAAIGKPMFISEWNHTKWSDYAYEGPAILTAVAMLQGVDVMTAHTYLPRHDPLAAVFSTDGLSIMGNPVLYALMPSLSRAFRNSPQTTAITRPKHIRPIDPATQSKRLAQLGTELKWINSRERLETGFTVPTRNDATRDSASAPLTWPDMPPASDPLISKPRLLEWRGIGTADANLTATTANFFMAVGRTPEEFLLSNGIKIVPSGKGTVTVVSLDTTSIGSARKLLITTVSTSHNTAERSAHIPLGTKRYKVMLTKGTDPSILRSNTLRLLVPSDSRRVITEILPLFADGRPAAGISSETVAGETVYEIGAHATPWYLMEILPR